MLSDNTLWYQLMMINDENLVINMNNHWIWVVIIVILTVVIDDIIKCYRIIHCDTNKTVQMN